MKVKELIEKLSQLEQEYEIYYTDKQEFWDADIHTIEKVEGQEAYSMN